MNEIFPIAESLRGALLKYSTLATEVCHHTSSTRGGGLNRELWKEFGGERYLGPSGTKGISLLYTP